MFCCGPARGHGEFGACAYVAVHAREGDDAGGIDEAVPAADVRGGSGTVRLARPILGHERPCTIMLLSILGNWKFLLTKDDSDTCRCPDAINQVRAAEGGGRW